MDYKDQKFPGDISGAFRHATIEQLQIIDELVVRANPNVIKMFTDWANGEWQPHAFDMPPIDWLIRWATMEDGR